MIYALVFSFLCFFLSSLGAGTVFFIKNFNSKLSAFMHAFAGGVMISSSIFSLILLAVDYCEQFNMKDYIVLPVCFLLSFLCFLLIDLVSKNKNQKINVPRLCLGIALHNIPEGMCIGFAFAFASVIGTSGAFMSAVMIALGIGFQNVPEGSTVSFPLKSVGYSKKKAFWMSVLVSFVEVPSAIIAFLIGLNFMTILPYMLSIAAALMMLVATTELLPEAVQHNKKIAYVSVFMGLLIMMVLDLALG